MVEDGHEEPADLRAVVFRSGHGRSLFQDVTLVADLDDRIRRITERSLNRIKAEFEGDSDDERLNCEQCVDYDECWFH